MQVLGALHKGYDQLPAGVKLASSGYDEVPAGVKLAYPTEPSPSGGFSPLVSGVADFSSAMDDLFSEVNEIALNTQADAPQYDAPTWLTGDIAPRHYKNLFHLRQATLEPDLEPEEYEKRMREVEMASAMVKARQQLAQQEHQKFVDSNDTEFSYSRRKEIEKLGDLGRLPGPIRGVAQGVNSLGGGVVSLLSRVIPGLGNADDHNRYLAEIEQRLTIQDEGPTQQQGLGTDLKTAGRRVAASVTEMAPSAAIGGTPLIAAQAGVNSANQAYTNAIDSGLSHEEAMRYAIGAGAIEGGLTLLFGKATPTLSRSMSRAMGHQAGQAAERLGVNTLLKSLAAETSEETTIAFSQAVLDRVSGVDPEAMEWGNLKKRLWESGLAGFMGGGVGATLQAVSGNVDEMATTVEGLKSEDAVQGFLDGLASDATTTPGMSRREFGKATGNGKTSEEYRKGFTAAGQITVEAPPVQEPEGGTTKPEPVDPLLPDARKAIEGLEEGADPIARLQSQLGIPGHRAERLLAAIENESLEAFDPAKLNAEAAAAAEVERLGRIEAARPEFNKLVGFMKKNAELSEWSVERLQHYFDQDPDTIQAVVEHADSMLASEQAPIDDMRESYENFVSSKGGERRDALAGIRNRLMNGQDPYNVKGFDVLLQNVRDNSPELLTWRRGPGDTDDSVLVNLIITPNTELFPNLRRADYIDRALLELDEMGGMQQPVTAGYNGEDGDPFDQGGVLADGDKTGRRPSPRPAPQPGPSSQTGQYLATEARNVNQPRGQQQLWPQAFPLDRLVNMPTPELTRLARELGAAVKASDLTPGVRGQFETREKIIRIARTLAGNPDQVKKTLAHEIGHFIDYLPDETMLRGNLLGRLASLKAFKKEFLAGVYKNSQLREEAKDVSFWWRPFDPRGASANHTAYRNSGVELYADIMSVFLNAPGELQQRAPMVFQAILEFMANKPDVAAKYIELQQRLQGSPEEISRERRKLIQDNYAKGDQQIVAAVEADKRADSSFLEAMYQDGVAAAWKHLRHRTLPAVQGFLFNRGAQIIHTQRQAGITDPLDTSRGVNVYNELEKLFRVQGVAYSWLERVGEFVYKPLIEAGLADADLGHYLQMRRIINDRADVLNPDGYLPETASQEISNLRTEMGEEKFRKLQEVAQTFYDLVFEVGERAVDAGIYSRDLWENVIVPNSDSYAAFAVLEYLENKIGWGIKDAKGTFDSIGNPYRATTMKMVATLHAAEINAAKQSILVEHLYRDAPDQVRAIQPGDPLKVKKGYERVTYLRDGEPITLEVPKHYAELFQEVSSSQGKALTNLMRSATYGIFYKLYINWNPSFAIRNILRDFERTYVLGGTFANAKIRERGGKPIRWYEIIGSMIKNLPVADRRAMQQFDPKINQMMASRALDVPFTSRSRHQSVALFEGEEYRKIAEQAGILPKKQAATWLGRGIETLTKHLPKRLSMIMPSYVIDVGEAANKAGVYDLLKGRGFSDEDAGQILHNFVGTPNTRFKGVGADGINTVSMFFSVRMANLRAHQLAMAADPKEYTRRMAIATTVDLLASKAARLGMFGATIAAIMALIPEDEEDRNHVVPLFLTTDPEDGQEKAVYLAIPRDQTGSFARTLMRKLYEAGVEGEDINPTELFQGGWSETAGTFSPPVDMAMRWGEYGMGHQPYDSYFHRPIVSDTEMRAGGWEAHRKMLAWTFKKFGAVEDLTKPLTAPLLGEAMQEGQSTTLESQLQSIPYASGLLKITDRGHKEDLFERARETDLATDKVSVMVDKGSSRLAAEHHAMSRLKEKLTEEEQAHYGRVHWWYQSVYLPYRKFMRDELQLGQKERATAIADDLKQLTAATKDYWVAVDSGDETRIRQTLETLENLTAE